MFRPELVPFRGSLVIHTDPRRACEYALDWPDDAVAVVNHNVVVHGDLVVKLTPAEFTLFVILFARPGRMVSQREIAETLWPGPEAGPDAWCSCIQVHTSNLRRRLALVGLAVDTPRAMHLSAAAAPLAISEAA